MIVIGNSTEDVIGDANVIAEAMRADGIAVEIIMNNVTVITVPVFYWHYCSPAVAVAACGPNGISGKALDFDCQWKSMNGKMADRVDLLFCCSNYQDCVHIMN